MVNPAVDIETMYDDILNKFEMLAGCVQVITRHPNLGKDTETLGLNFMAWTAESILEDAQDLFRDYDLRLRALARSNGEANHEGDPASP